MDSAVFAAGEGLSVESWLVVGAIFVGPAGLLFQWYWNRRDKLSREAKTDRTSAQELEDAAQREAWSQITDTSVQFTQIASALVEPMVQQIAALKENQVGLQAQVEEERRIREAEQTLRLQMEAKMAGLQRRFEVVVVYVAELREQARAQGWEPLPVPDELDEHFPD